MTTTKRMRLDWTDTETSGLAGTIDEAIKLDRQVIEYASVRWEDGEITRRYERKVMPTGDAIKDAEHCASQGWNHFAVRDWLVPTGNPREYTAAKPWDETDCEQVFEALDGGVLAGSNPRFDLTMLKAEFARRGCLEQFPKLATHRMLDIGQGAWFLWSAGLVERTGLETLAKHLGVEHKAHTAMGDVLASIACFEKLCDEYIFRPRKLAELVRAAAECAEDAVDSAAMLRELEQLGPGL